MKEWYLKKQAKFHGPYAKEEISELLFHERINRDSLIKKRRDADWVRLHTLLHLFKVDLKTKSPQKDREYPEPDRFHTT